MEIYIYVFVILVGVSLIVMQISIDQQFKKISGKLSDSLEQHDDAIDAKLIAIRSNYNEHEKMLVDIDRSLGVLLESLQHQVHVGIINAETQKQKPRSVTKKKKAK